MSQGQVALLRIPANKGSKGLGGKFEFKPPFPPDGDLEFEVELLKVTRNDQNIII